MDHNLLKNRYHQILILVYKFTEKDLLVVKEIEFSMDSRYIPSLSADQGISRMIKLIFDEMLCTQSYTVSDEVS